MAAVCVGAYKHAHSFLKCTRQCRTNISRTILPFSQSVTILTPGRNLSSHLHSCTNKLHIREYTHTKLHIIQNHVSAFPVAWKPYSGPKAQVCRSYSVSTLQIQSCRNASTSLKENQRLKRRRPDPIKVARQVFQDIKKRHRDHFLDHQSSKTNRNKIFAASNEDRDGKRPRSMIDMNYLFREPNRARNSNEINPNFISRQTDDFQNMGSTDLFKTLQQIHLSHKYKSHEYKRTVFAIERVLYKRIEDVGLNMSLNIADVLFMMGADQRHFDSAMFDYITNSFNTLEITPVQLTRIMFYVFLHGSGPPHLFPKVEEYLSSHINEFHINDIGVVCLGFFRSIRRIKSTKLLEDISDRLLADIGQVNHHNLVNILKSFRHSGYNNVTFFENLAESLITNEILQNCLNVNLLMHIVSTYAGLSIFHSRLLEVILKQFVNVVCNLDKQSTSLIRSKDLARFVWAYGVFVFEPVKHRDAYMKLVSAYRNNVDKDDAVYPESLADMLQGLMYLQIFPQDLITKMFNIKTAVKLRDDEVMTKAIQLLMIHNAVTIECPQYSGPRLQQSFVASLSNVDEVKKSVDFELLRREGLADVRNTLTGMFGEDCVQCHFILSQFRNADIELQFYKNHEPVKFKPQEFNSNWLHEDKCDNTRIVIEVAGHNQFCTKSSRMKGNYDTKLRQLRLLGYHVILITPHQIENFQKMTDKEREEFLTKCISDVWYQS